MAANLNVADAGTMNTVSKEAKRGRRRRGRGAVPSSRIGFFIQLDCGMVINA